MDIKENYQDLPKLQHNDVYLMKLLLTKDFKVPTQNPSTKFVNTSNISLWLILLQCSQLFLALWRHALCKYFLKSYLEIDCKLQYVLELRKWLDKIQKVNGNSGNMDLRIDCKREAKINGQCSLKLLLEGDSPMRQQKTLVQPTLFQELQQQFLPLKESTKKNYATGHNLVTRLKED